MWKEELDTRIMDFLKGMRGPCPECAGKEQLTLDLDPKTLEEVNAPKAPARNKAGRSRGEGGSA